MLTKHCHKCEMYSGWLAFFSTKVSLFIIMIATFRRSSNELREISLKEEQESYENVEIKKKTKFMEGFPNYKQQSSAWVRSIAAALK